MLPLPFLAAWMNRTVLASLWTTSSLCMLVPPGWPMGGGDARLRG